MDGYLISQGVRVQRQRIRNSLYRLDPHRQELRTISVVHRRHYSVQSPLSLWHIDGHHKLIRWVGLFCNKYCYFGPQWLGEHIYWQLFIHGCFSVSPPQFLVWGLQSQAIWPSDFIHCSFMYFPSLQFWTWFHSYRGMYICKIVIVLITLLLVSAIYILYVQFVCFTDGVL